MALDFELETEAGSFIVMTLLSPEESGSDVREALLTVRGKDHDLSANDLEKLGMACLRFAKHIRDKK